MRNRVLNGFENVLVISRSWLFMIVIVSLEVSVVFSVWLKQMKEREET